MNENPAESEVASAPSSSVPAPNPGPAAFDPRRRIRELLSIPDRDRSDAEWDELNELEIQTAPGNRAAGGQSSAYPNNKPAGFHQKNRMKGKGKPGGGRPPQQAKPSNKPPRPA
jgi:hypothetical protein